MLEARLKHPSRAPSAICIGVGLLLGYKIKFHKIGMDGSAKCNAFATGNKNDFVYGVVFDVSEKDLAVLDEEEDIERGGYYRRKVNVIMQKDSKQYLVECYFANSEFIDNTLYPFEWYKELVIAGAREHDLPDDYISMLDVCPGTKDNDHYRVMKVKKILGQSYGQ